MGSLDAANKKELVLLGGGHSHALVLRMLGMNPLDSARLTVVSNVSYTPYSGMLPGYIGGQYTYDDVHIDLRRLAEFAGARFILGETKGLDLNNKQLQFNSRPPLDFDLLSINIGSTPSMASVPGAVDHTIPIKPIPAFLKAWNSIVAEASERPRSLIIVGGGAGGVELAMSMQKRLGSRARVHLIDRETELLTSHTAKVREMTARLCRDLGIELHLGDGVSEVKSNEIRFASGKKLEADTLFWVTHASPAPWIQSSGLEVDSAGFILTGNTLQSTSHDFVFAAGDVASMHDTPRPKSGVYAVRQAKPLLANLRSFCNGTPLRPYRPQKKVLALIGTGATQAVACKGRMAHCSSLMLTIKDNIDRRFMRKFSDLPPMPRTPMEPNMRCLGCAAKVGAPILHRAIQRIRSEQSSVPTRDDIIIGLNQPDDASIIKIPDGTLLVQSKDYFPAMITDPWIMGKILTLHSFSDIFAMGATPHSALALVLVPRGSDRMMESDLYQCLAGISEALEEMGAILLGGHTAEADRFGLGLTCNGLIESQAPLRKQGLREGDALILTKPLGTGTLFAAQMRQAARGRWIDGALASMLCSNQEAASIFIRHGAVACTDVTGFGLLGHLGEMLPGSGLGVEVNLGALPVLDGAVSTAKRGFLSTLDPQNRKREDLIVNPKDLAHYDLLFDPQTSGGLLAGVPPSCAEACLTELKSAHYPQATLIGRVIKPTESGRPIYLVS